MQADVTQRERFLYAYGFVQYLDIYRRKHETRFGLLYNLPFQKQHVLDHWKLAGPSVYNRYK